MSSSNAAYWRVIYIAHGEKQAQRIEDLLCEAGFLVDRQRLSPEDARQEDIEIRVLLAEAQEARMYLLDQGF